MRTKIQTLGLASGILLALLALQSSARADQFDFTFATDLTGCAGTSGGCGPGTGQGVFTTAPLTTGPQFGTGGAYPIESLTGLFNGSAMTLDNPGSSAIDPSTLNLLSAGPGVIFTASGSEYELEFNEGPHAPGSNDLLYSFSSNTFTNVALTVTPVSVPEPATLSFVGAGLLGLGSLAFFKNRIA